MMEKMRIDKLNKNGISVKKLVGVKFTNTAPGVEHARFHKFNSMDRKLFVKAPITEKLKLCRQLIVETEYHGISTCRNFQNLTASEQKSAVLRSGFCCSCLDNHKVRNCDKNNNCRRCRDRSLPKHFYL